MVKIIVTGGAGYIGSYLIKKLIENGFFVISIDNLINGDYRFLKKYEDDSLKLVRGDIRDLDLLEREFADADHVIHLAAISTLDKCYEDPEEAVSVNVYGTFQILEAAKRTGVKRIIFSSSAAVYGEPRTSLVDESHPVQPLNLYGITKLSGEKLIESYSVTEDIESVVLRFGNVFGVGLYTHWDSVIPKFVKQALDHVPLTIYGGGESIREFVHVEDIVKAIMLAVNSKEVSYDLFNVGGEAMSVRDVASIVSGEVKKVAGFDVKLIHLPERRGEAKKICFRMDKIEKKLGYKREYTVKQGVSQLIEYYNRIIEERA
ncbi:MAG: NAD-dependent epimerase/dehydratase family protein [Candidatus Bathyarchaeia archaeon]